MKNQEFKFRSGCLDYGSTYEILIAAYYGLQLSLSKDVSDFKISTNNKDLGKFDDVVLEVKYDNGDEHLYALQLKHRGAKEDNITLSAFDADKGNFGLKKYLSGFQETEKTCKNNPRYNISFEKFYFILFTNQVVPNFHIRDENHKKIEVDEVKLKSLTTIYRYDKCVARNLLNLSEAENFLIFKFRNDTKKFDANFLDRFYLYTKQKDVKEVECLTSKFISSIFNNCDPNVVTNYINFFKFWWRGDFGKVKLTKRDIILKLSEYVLTPHIPEVNFESILPDEESALLLNQVFENFDLVVIDNLDVETEVKIWRCILNRHFKERFGVTCSWSQPLSGDSNFFGQDTKIPISAQGENLVDQSLKKFYTILWHLDKVPLFIKICDKYRKGIYAALKLLEHQQQKKRFVVVDKNFVEEEFSDDLKILQSLKDLADFKDIYQKICNGFTISLQGRSFVKIEELTRMDCGLVENISTKKLIEMLTTNFIIGNDCTKKLPKCYVTRLTPKILLNFSVIDEIQDDIFVIDQGSKKQKFSCNTYDLEKYLVLKESGTTEQFSKKVVVVTNTCSKREFNKICQLNRTRNCHHLRINSSDKVEWIESEGSINRLKPYLKKHKFFDDIDFVKDIEILDYYSNKINIICADPGIGKSVLLKFLKCNCSSDYWVIKVDLIEHIKFFKEEHTLGEVFAYLLESESKDNFVKNFIDIFLKRKKVLFMWDGFDELPKKCIIFVVALIKLLSQEGYNQWISARSNLRTFLENTFNSLSLTITHFSKSAQQEFIYKNLKSRYNDEEEVQALVSTLNKNMSLSLSCGSFDFTGVPLHVYMMIEIFLKNPEKYLKEFKIVILTDIYQYFVEEKFNDLFQRARVSRNNLVMQKIQQKFKNTQISQLEIAALKATFDDEVFSTLNIECDNFLQGIVENGDSLGFISSLDDENKPIFTHKTYEEFLTASWLVKNCAKHPNLRKNLFKDEFKNIRLMFDMILGRDSPVHVAVLYRNLDFLKNYGGDFVSCRDKGERTALQLACSWGSEHVQLPVVTNNKEITIVSVDEDAVKADQNEKIVEYLLACNCDPFEIDTLNGWNAVSYADKAFSLAALEAIASFTNEIVLSELTNFKDIDILYYSIKFNYRNLFYQLKDYSYFEIKLKDGDLCSLLQFAVQMNRLDFVKTLLTFPHYQKVINKPYKDLSNPLSSATYNGNIEMFNFLQAKGAIINPNQPSPLIAAVALGHAQFCQKLLDEKKADPNECYVDGNSVLQVAALNNQLSIMQMLLNYGAEVNFVNFFDLTTLDYCIDNRSLEGVKLLLNNGADVNRQGTKLYGYTPLHCACELGDDEIVKLLIKFGSNPSLKSQRLYTPLHVALINKQERIAKLLIETDPTVINEYSEEKSTPIMLATLENYSDIIQILANMGADVDSVESKDSPLRLATLKKFEKCVETLIKCGASVNRTDNFGFTPLFYSVGKEVILKMFLNAPSIDVNVKSLTLVSALHFATENGKVDSVEELVKHGADVNAQDLKKQTSLHYAVKNKHNEVVKCLLKYKADISDGTGLLRLACLKDAPDCLLTLLNSGIDVNSYDNNGRTALHFAAMTSLFCTKILILKGANVNKCDNNGFSPLYFAVFLNKLEIIKSLINEGADVNTKSSNLSLLHLSAGLGNVASTVFLISLGCDVNAQDEILATPLHYVVRQSVSSLSLQIMETLKCYSVDFQIEPNFEDCARELLEKGALVTIRDISERTPLTTAACCNNLNMLKTFYEKFKTDADWQESFFIAAHNNSMNILHFLNENGLIDINGRKVDNEMTALHYACIGNGYEAANYLIRNGADVNAVTTDGCTPLYFAAAYGYFELVKLLVEHEAEVDIPNNHGNTSFFSAASGGFLNIVVFLHENHAAIDVIDADGDTPVHDAAANGHVNVVQYLISKGANLESRNKNGKTPKDLGEDNERENVLKFLTSLTNDNNL